MLCQACVLLQLHKWEGTKWGGEWGSVLAHTSNSGAPGRAAELCGVLWFLRKPPVKSKAETKKATSNTLSSGRSGLHAGR